MDFEKVRVDSEKVRVASEKVRVESVEVRVDCDVSVKSEMSSDLFLSPWARISLAV